MIFEKIFEKRMVLDSLYIRKAENRQYVMEKSGKNGRGAGTCGKILFMNNNLTPGIREYLRRAPVTSALALANILFFFWVETHGSSGSTRAMIRWGASFAPLIREEGEYWRLLTAAFLHFGFSHLANNMFLLLVMGERLERIMGHAAFLALYLSAAVGGNAVSVMLESPLRPSVSAGASGAVFGIIGGMLAVVVKNGGYFEGLSTRRMMFFAGLSVFYGFTAANVDNTAHVAGFIIGFLAAMLLYRKERRARY